MLLRSIRRILKRINLRIIHKRIESGKTVYFESPLEELAFKYIPGKPGKPEMYLAKYYGQDEYAINSDSSSVFLALNEGKLICKHRYEKYHLIKGAIWDRKIKTTSNYITAGA